LKKAFKRCYYLSITALQRNRNTVSPQHSSEEMNKLVNIRGEPLLNISSEEEIRETYFTQLNIIWEFTEK